MSDTDDLQVETTVDISSINHKPMMEALRQQPNEVAEEEAQPFDDDVDVQPVEPVDYKQMTVDRIKRRTLVIKMKNYIREFNDVLTDFRKDITRAEDGSMSFEEMECVLEEMKYTVATRNSQTMIVNKSFFTGTGIIEAFAPAIGFNCEGLTNILMNSKECTDTLKEIALDKEIMYVSPEKRLMLIVASTAYQLNSINKKVEPTKKQLDNPVNDVMMEKANGL